MDMRDMALWAIEFLASSEGEPSEELMGNIYSIAHAVVGECSAPHQDWIDLTKKVYVEAVLQGYGPVGRKRREEFDKRSSALLRPHERRIAHPTENQP